jgi:Glycosyl hydrolases family 39
LASNGSHTIYAKAADAAGNWGASAAVSVTVQNGTSASVTVTVDRSQATGKSWLGVGVTHTGYSLDYWGNATALDNGKRLLAAATMYQNQHIYGWGAANPEPRPGVFDWTTLDRRINLIRSQGAIPVITLCCAPDWMTSLGTTTSTLPLLPPTPSHYGDFAELARQVALRYRDVKNFMVWNEMKGLWSNSLNNWDYVNYTNLYNAVYDALKSVDPTIKVGGPYLVLEGTGSLKGDWSTQVPISARNMKVIDYWLQNKHGADFLVLTRRVLDWHDGNPYSQGDLLSLTHLFADTARQVATRSSLPLWWSEDYCAGGGRPAYNAMNEDWAFQAACLGSMLLHELLGGSTVSLRWGAQGEAGSWYGGNDENLFSDTRVIGGGQPFPSYWAYRAFDDYFPPGTTLYRTTSSSPDVEVLASATNTLLINKRSSNVTVSVNGTLVTLDRYSVRVV